MRLTIENTEEITSIVTPQGEVPARVWVGHTAAGIPVQCLITRIAVHRQQDHSAFEAELAETPPVQPVTPRAFDRRLVL